MKASCAQSFAASPSAVIRSAMLYTRPPYRSTKSENALASPARQDATTSWSLRVIPDVPAGCFAYSRALHGSDMAPPPPLPPAPPPGPSGRGAAGTHRGGGAAAARADSQARGGGGGGLGGQGARVGKSGGERHACKKKNDDIGQGAYIGGGSKGGERDAAGVIVDTEKV